MEETTVKEMDTHGPSRDNVQRLALRKREIEELEGDSATKVVIDDVRAYHAYQFRYVPTADESSTTQFVVAATPEDNPGELLDAYLEDSLDEARFVDGVAPYDRFSNWHEAEAVRESSDWEVMAVGYVAVDIRYEGGEATTAFTLSTKPWEKVESTYRKFDRLERTNDTLVYDGDDLYTNGTPRKRTAFMIGISTATIGILVLPTFVLAETHGFGVSLGYVFGSGIALIALNAAVGDKVTWFEEAESNALHSLDLEACQDDFPEDSPSDSSSDTTSELRFETVTVDADEDGTVVIEAEDLDATWTYPGEDGQPNRDAFWVFDREGVEEHGFTTLAVREHTDDEDAVHASDDGGWVFHHAGSTDRTSEPDC